VLLSSLHFQDYKKPLEESSPPILSQSKIATLFYRLPEILQCHTLFRIALAECVRSWDKDEKLGDVFVASFSKAIVLDIYSGFINNFSVAMDLAKQESKRKTALADFFKVLVIRVIQKKRKRIWRIVMIEFTFHVLCKMCNTGFIYTGETNKRSR